MRQKCSRIKPLISRVIRCSHGHFNGKCVTDQIYQMMSVIFAVRGVTIILIVWYITASVWELEKRFATITA